MRTKQGLLIKLITGLCFTILFVSFGAALAGAAELDIYGNLGFTYSTNFYKDPPEVIPGLGTWAGGDLFIRGSDDQSLLQFLLDLKYDSNILLKDTTLSGVYANQYYVIVPVTESSFLYGGKKYKNIGVAKFFRISNRYGYPANLLEYDILSSDSFNYGFVLNTLNAANWTQVQTSAFADYNVQNFNMQGYYYQEGGQRNAVAVNLTYQLGSIQMYGEAIHLSKSDQMIIGESDQNDLSKDLVCKDLKDTTKLTAGLMMNLKNYSVTLEYCRNNQGLDQKEQDDLINYLGDTTNAVDANELFQNFHYSYSRSYLAFQFSLPKLFSNDYSFNTSIVASMPEGGGSPKYLGYETTLNFSYNAIQNLTLNLGATYRSGGDKGEFLILNKEKLVYQFGIQYSF